ncbi:MAG: ribosome recycling factor [Bacilli bacterium]|nr:ribosome recycling factor [Bacilli bacterium]
MDELTLQAKAKFDKTVISLRETLVTLRTGRANPNMLDKVQADYYGDKMPINQIAAITSPEPRQILVKPYDKNDVKAIVAAISASGLNLNPTVDGNQIRIIIAPLTEETRKTIVKQAKQMAEDAKVALRNVRREYLDFLKDDESYSDDLKERIQDEISKVFDEASKNIDAAYANKEKEILTL